MINNPETFDAPTKDTEDSCFDFPSFSEIKLAKSSSNFSLIYGEGSNMEEGDNFGQLTADITHPEEEDDKLIQDEVEDFKHIEFIAKTEIVKIGSIYSTPQIVNSHASFWMNCEMDLRLLTKKLKNAIYNPKKINACVIKRGKITVVVFASGKAVILGGKSKEEASLESKKVAK